MTDFAKLSDTLSKPGLVITDFSNFSQYLHDATDRRGQPAALVMAAREEDVIATINFCKENSLPVVARGAGTGLSGGCVPVDGGIVLSTERINHLRIDPESMTAVCGPGLITKALMDAAAQHGLTYPPDPASYDESTLGGNVAENAGGLRCKKYGVTRDYILGMRAITSCGSILTTGCYNNYQGFNIGDLLIGSEGTLAVITELTVRLIPQPPPGITVLVAFDDPRKAGQTVSDIIGNGIIPMVMEFLDGDAADCSNRYEKTDGLDNVAAILLIETAGESGTEQLATIEEISRKNGCSYWRAERQEERAQQLWKVRRNLSKAVKQMAKFRISEDVAVPISKFPDLIAFVARINATSPLRINSFGHAGDGNLHVNFLCKSDSSDDIKEMEEGISKLMHKTIELNGTLTGEHGIGLEKRKYLPLEFDPATLGKMTDLKAVFDPANILNPGKLFEERKEK